MAIFIGGAPHGIGLIDGVPIAEVKLNGQVLWGPGLDINVVSGQFTQAYLDAVGWTQRRGYYIFRNEPENAFGYVTPQTSQAYINYNSDGTNTNQGELVQQGLDLSDGVSYTFRVYRSGDNGSGTQSITLDAYDGNGDLIVSGQRTTNGWVEIIFTPTAGALTTQLYISMSNTFGEWPAGITVSEIQFYETP